MGAVSRETLAELAAEFGLPAATAGQFGRLLDALAAEPDPHTTVSDPRRAVDVHLRDSLAALAVPALREAAAAVDIGSGAGFPGLPLAIALPGVCFDLVESASRKVAVIDRLAAAAELHNVRPVHARVEEWALAAGVGPRAEDAVTPPVRGGPRAEDAVGPCAGGAPLAGDRPAASDRPGRLAGGGGAYDVATARAVAPLAVLAEYAAPLLRVGGTFIAWKGAPDAAEIASGVAAAEELGLQAYDPLPVTPYPSARDLHLYLYSKVRETPAKYPRRPGMAAKRPLGA